MPSSVWFQLYDSDGNIYKETCSDYVSLSDKSFVAVFRDVVKAKYDQTYYLKDIPSGALRVYKNKAAFIGEEGPLKSSSSLKGLGKTDTENEALAVVVPPPLPTSSSSSPFTSCKDPFYNSIFNATEANGWLLLEHDIPSTNVNKLYIRESYRTIASNFNPGINKVIITGTPGIGKSLFLIYLLAKLVKEGKRVLFIYDEENFYSIRKYKHKYSIIK